MIETPPNAVHPKTSDEWRAWLEEHHTQTAGVIANARMTAAGLAKIEAAKQDGSWSSLDAAEALEIPPDLEKALAEHGAARRNFEAFPPSTKKGILTWIGTAKRPETRAKRVEETARLAAENIRASSP